MEGGRRKCDLLLLYLINWYVFLVVVAIVVAPIAIFVWAIVTEKVSQR
jgi:hypothetical protein